ncbi:MAG TPA: DUF4178 domain-containing protein [Abditibacteriaceae bacterium]|jgi:hypothetical protein
MKRFEIGEIGEIGAHWFKVRARVVYGNAEGLWDEWCLELHDGSIGWLETEDGQTFLSRKQRLTSPVPPFEVVSVGQMFPVGQHNFFVVEKCRAEIMQIEGDAPVGIGVGDQVRFVDGAVDGRAASLEYGPDAIEFVLGDTIERGGILSADAM